MLERINAERMAVIDPLVGSSAGRAHAALLITASLVVIAGTFAVSDVRAQNYQAGGGTANGANSNNSRGTSTADEPESSTDSPLGKR